MINRAKIDHDLRSIAASIGQLTRAFNREAAFLEDNEWVKAYLLYMVDVDQLAVGHAFDSPFLKDNHYTDEEKDAFVRAFIPRLLRINEDHADALKELMKTHEWFSVSEFGKEAEEAAWLIVQHADHDRELQKKALALMEKLYPIGEVKPSHYAYLYDRVAVSLNNPCEARPERYGTQGDYNHATNTWRTVEDPEHLAALVNEMGLSPVLVTRREKPLPPSPAWVKLSQQLVHTERATPIRRRASRVKLKI